MVCVTSEEKESRFCISLLRHESEGHHFLEVASFIFYEWPSPLLFHTFHTCFLLSRSLKTIRRKIFCKSCVQCLLCFSTSFFDFKRCVLPQWSLVDCLIKQLFVNWSIVIVYFQLLTESVKSICYHLPVNVRG